MPSDPTSKAKKKLVPSVPTFKRPPRLPRLDPATLKHLAYALEWEADQIADRLNHGPALKGSRGAAAVQQVHMFAVAAEIVAALAGVDLVFGDELLLESATALT